MEEIDISVVSQADPATGVEIPSGRPRANVARDLEAIFAPLPRPVPGTQTGLAVDKGSATPRPRPTQRRGGTIIALILMALLAAAAVALASWWYIAPPRTVPQPSTSFRRASAPPAEAPVATSSTPSIGTTAAHLADAPDDRAAPPLAQHPPSGAIPTTAAGMAPAPPRRPEPVTHASIATAAQSFARPTAVVPPVRADTTAAAVATPAPKPAKACDPGATEAWCLRNAVAEADATLRTAYAAAVSAGVKRASLVEIKRDWSRLRRDALKDPQTLLRGYAALTDQLRLQTRQARP